MKIIKLGLISLVFFAVMITLISFFFPSHVRISRAVDIDADKGSVMVQLKDTANWRNWYPGADTLMPSVIISSNDSVIQFQQAREGKKAEEGWNIISADRPHTITVQWYMDIRLSWYPWDKFSSLLLEKRYGPFMERGLTSLKVYLEKNN
jgi:hypothetical protein